MKLFSHSIAVESLAAHAHIIGSSVFMGVSCSVAPASPGFISDPILRVFTLKTAPLYIGGKNSPETESKLTPGEPNKTDYGILSPSG
jgi:hypothetical protein